MRILTVRQPWAWAVIHGGKDVENRTRNIAGDYRGPVAIHAGQTAAIDWFDDGGAADQIAKLAGFYPGIAQCALGAIIGVADLIDVHWCSLGYCCYHEEFDTPLGVGLASVCCSEWGEECSHHLCWENPRPLPQPIPYRGALGLRELPPEVEAQVWEALR